MSTGRPYEIYWSSFTHQSGGVRALYVLRDELRARGLDAWTRDERQDATAIGIYPEVIPTNPAGYERVVRWLLNKATLPDDGKTFAWATGMGDYPLLTVNILEPHLFTPFKGRRKGVGYWVGKGVFDPRFVPDGAKRIGRDNIPTRAGLAAELRSLDYLISFDPFTAVNLEAVCLGTPVLVRNGGQHWQRAEVEAQGWLPYGLAWSMRDLDKARATVGQAYEHYQSMLPGFSRTVDEFVEVTQGEW
jgi:hypothetical protein